MDDLDDWPDTTATVILPRLWMGGIEDDEYLGEPITGAHYDFDCRYDVMLTLYADAQPAPWGVTELRYGFPDDDVPEHLTTPCLPLAQYGWSAWRSGATVLVRCQQGVNRSGLVTALLLMFDGMAAGQAIELLRERRGAAVLNNLTFETWLLENAPTYLNPTTLETQSE
jgi:protein-tyrosine phosphatase